MVASPPRWAVQQVAVNRPDAPTPRKPFVTVRRLRHLAIVLAITAVLLVAFIAREGLLDG